MMISLTALTTKLFFTLFSVTAASFLHFLVSNAFYELHSLQHEYDEYWMRMFRSHFHPQEQTRDPLMKQQQQKQLYPIVQQEESQNQQQEAVPVSSTSTSSSSAANVMGYTKEALKDRIDTLPGLSFQPNFQQFSGYFAVSPTRNIHYWYIESSHNATTDPVLFWTNGGPGCSGLIGLGAEFGPFLIDKHGILTPNNYTWNQVASILYVEQPAGVGFSYYTGANDTFVDDERATMDNYQVIQEFLIRFPERRLNDFYIASESYGGHYIPHLAKKILEESAGGGGNSLNFRGFLVGNPFVDPFTNYVTMIQTYYMHGLISLPLYREWEHHCTDKSHYPLHRCNFLVYTIFKQAGDRINPYALDYPVCSEDEEEKSTSSKEESSAEVRHDSNSTAANQQDNIISPSSPSSHISVQSATLMRLGSISTNAPPFLPTGDVYDPCAGLHLHQYLNRDDVKDALHVERSRKWRMCTNTNIEYSRKDYNTPQMHLYKKIIRKAQEESGINLKMMVYSGDDDSSKLTC